MTEHEEHPVDYLPELALGVLPEGQAQSVRAHVDACESCRAEFEEMNRVARLLPLAAEDVAPSPAAREGLMERIAREPRPIGRGHDLRARRWSFPAAAALGLLVAVGTTGFLFGRAGDDSSAEAERSDALVGAIANGSASSASIEKDGMRAVFLRAPDASHGFIWVEGMPPLPSGKAYQA